MQKRILINGVTLDDANLTPLLLKVKFWQSQGFSVDFFCNQYTKRRIEQSGILSEFGFIELKSTHKVTGKIGFIAEVLFRNCVALFYLNKTKNKYDVIYTISSVLDLIIFPYILKIFDKKIVWATVFDNTVPLLQGGRSRAIRLLVWIFFNSSLFFLRRADAIFPISEELSNFLLAKNFRDDFIVVTGNAIEVDLVKKASKKDEYKTDILFVGRINTAKGIYDMLEVLAILKRKFHNIQLSIMGSGDKSTENDFKEKIKKLGLMNNVRFLGFKNGLEKFNIIKSSKSFLFLSSNESFGVALLEAVCCGVPVFAYDLPIYRKIYKKNEIDLSEKGNFDLVAKKMIRFFSEKNFNNSDARELLFESYTWDAIAKKELCKFNDSKKLRKKNEFNRGLGTNCINN